MINCLSECPCHIGSPRVPCRRSRWRICREALLLCLCVATACGSECQPSPQILSDAPPGYTADSADGQTDGHDFESDGDNTGAGSIGTNDPSDLAGGEPNGNPDEPVGNDATEDSGGNDTATDDSGGVSSGQQDTGGDGEPSEGSNPGNDPPAEDPGDAEESPPGEEPDDPEDPPPGDDPDEPGDELPVPAGATLAASLLSADQIVAALSAIGDLQRKVTETEQEQNVSALRRVQAYRMLLGLRWDVTIDPADVQLADAAADICMQVGTLTHSPARPPGMSDEQYALAQQGAAQSNLATRYPLITIPYSIDLYMDDSDASNIAHLGHRRWIMSPIMRATGFGLSSDNRYSAMHVFPDAELASACFSDATAIQSWDMILYPRWGHMPTNYFAGAHVAWSISLRGNGFNADQVTAADISVRPADAANNPTGSPLTISYFARSTLNYGCQHPVLIFRPQGVQVYAGQRYRVTIMGVTDDQGNPAPIDYWVAFFKAPVTVVP